MKQRKETQNWGLLMHARIVDLMVCDMKSTGMVAIKATSWIVGMSAFTLTRALVTGNESVEGKRKC